MPQSYAMLTVLVLDPQAARRQQIANTLWQLGLRRIYEAAGDAAALQLVSSSWPRPDLLICDFDLDDAERVATVRQLATEQPMLGLIAGAPFDAKTADTAEQVLQQCRARLIGTLGRHFDVAQLRQLLDIYLAPAKPARPEPPPTLDSATVGAALREQWIRVHYQPQIRLADNTLVGVEALVRLDHPVYGLLPANSFVASADAAGLAPALAIRVMELAIAQLGEWWRSGLHIGLSINLSPLALTRVYLPDVAAELAARAEVPPSAITFELAAKSMPTDTDTLLSMNHLRVLEFRLAVDDDSRGLGDLHRLRNMPFSELKLDRSSIEGAAQNRDQRATLRANVELARQLHLDVVAEGVERQEDWDMLREVECARAQGFIAARPMPPQQLQPWAHDWDGRQLH